MTVVTDSYNASRNTLYKRVTIVSVDMKNLVIEGMDNKRGIYHIDCTMQPEMVRIPRIGEDWVIEHLNNFWKLLYRYEKTDDRTPINTLQEGDVRIEGNSIHINGVIYRNGEKEESSKTIYGVSPIGLIDGVNKEFYLPTTFISESLEIYVNGLRAFDFVEISNSGFEFDLAPFEFSVISVNYKVPLEEFSTAGSQIDPQEMG
jgi:hypothetical protein